MRAQIDQFFTLVEAFRDATGLAEATISTRALHDGKRIGMLRSGRDIGVRRLAEAFQWFSDHWPADTAWPVDIPRPCPQSSSTAPVDPAPIQPAEAQP